MSEVLSIRDESVLMEQVNKIDIIMDMKEVVSVQHSTGKETVPLELDKYKKRKIKTCRMESSRFHAQKQEIIHKIGEELFTCMSSKVTPVV